MRKRRIGNFCRSRGDSSPGSRRPAPASVSITGCVRASDQPYYDPLLAKIIAHGPTREAARRKLIQALEDTIALGVATNRAFLIECLISPNSSPASATTQFIPTHFGKIAMPAR